MHIASSFSLAIYHHHISMHFSQPTYRVHPKLSLMISVGVNTDGGSAMIGVPTDHLQMRQFGMHPFNPDDKTIYQGAKVFLTR
ncbi:MAG: hypothetical protein ABIN01_18490 [Ferruginibacter sp.]